MLPASTSSTPGSDSEEHGKGPKHQGIKLAAALALVALALGAPMVFRTQEVGWEGTCGTAYIVLGRVVRVNYDEHCDGTVEERAFYLFDEKVQVMECTSFTDNPSLIMIDGDADGSWDTWLTRLGTPGAEYRVDIDLDADGTIDHSFSAFIMGLEETIREAFWRPALCERYGATAVPRSPHWLQPDRLAARLRSEEMVSEEAYADYWRRVIAMVEDQGTDLFLAQELVGGCLPDDVSFWPAQQRQRLDQLVTAGTPEHEAKNQVRDEYWAATWNE